MASRSVDSEYEFLETENAVIGSTGVASTAWGVTSLVLSVGVLGLAAYVVVTFGTAGFAVGSVVFLGAAVQLVTSWFYIQAGSAFRRVVNTEGEDVTNAVQAVRTLTSAVRIEAIAAIVAFFVGLVLAFTLVAGR